MKLTVPLLVFIRFLMTGTNKLCTMQNRSGKSKKTLTVNAICDAFGIQETEKNRILAAMKKMTKHLKFVNRQTVVAQKIIGQCLDIAGIKPDPLKVVGKEPGECWTLAEPIMERRAFLTPAICKLICIKTVDARLCRCKKTKAVLKGEKTIAVVCLKNCPACEETNSSPQPPQTASSFACHPELVREHDLLSNDDRLALTLLKTGNGARNKILQDDSDSLLCGKCEEAEDATKKLWLFIMARVCPLVVCEFRKFLPAVLSNTNTALRIKTLLESINPSDEAFLFTCILAHAKAAITEAEKTFRDPIVLDALSPGAASSPGGSTSTEEQEEQNDEGDDSDNDTAETPEPSAKRQRTGTLHLAATKKGRKKDNGDSEMFKQESNCCTVCHKVQAARGEELEDPNGWCNALAEELLAQLKREDDAAGISSSSNHRATANATREVPTVEITPSFKHHAEIPCGTINLWGAV